jgi:glycosyltransferase involved in cell wall biosynthesis
VERFKARARDLSLDAVCEFPGWVDAGKVPGFLAQNDLFVLPSFHEGLPMAILECLSAGVPVIITPVGSLPEVLADRQTCLFVTPGDVEALVAAIKAIQQDRALYAHLSTAGRDLFEKTFHVTGYVQRLRSIYQTVLGIGKDVVRNGSLPHP